MTTGHNGLTYADAGVDIDAGNALVDAFIQTRNWPFGSAMAVGLILIMMASVTFYVWFMNRGSAAREVSVL